MQVPSNINVAAARLPQAYEAAKVALANCASLDECQEWANKAEALASYAKQADDYTLRRCAERIQARAVRRVGELLKTIEPSKGGRPASNSGRDDPSLAGWIPGTGGAPEPPDLAGLIPGSRKEAADAAGLNERKRKTALRVANVPADVFAAAVDSDNPPSVGKLAEMGTQTRPPKPEPPLDYTGLQPIDFVASSKLSGSVHRFAEFCAENDPERMAAVVMPHQLAEFRRAVAAIDSWLDRFVVKLPGP